MGPGDVTGRHEECSPSHAVCSPAPAVHRRRRRGSCFARPVRLHASGRARGARASGSAAHLNASRHRVGAFRLRRRHSGDSLAERARGARPAATLAVGFGFTLALTGAAFAVQRPDYDYARGDLQVGVEHWESVIDAGRRAARPGTPLARALASLHRTGPEPCRDAYGRATGGARYRWASPRTPHDEPVAASTVPALTAWARTCACADCQQCSNAPCPI